MSHKKPIDSFNDVDSAWGLVAFARLDASLTPIFIYLTDAPLLTTTALIMILLASRSIGVPKRVILDNFADQYQAYFRLAITYLITYRVHNAVEHIVLVSPSPR